MTSSFVRLLKMLKSRKVGSFKRRPTFKRMSKSVQANKNACKDRSSNNVYCLKMMNGKANKYEWYFIKVPMPLDSERRIIEGMREVNKKREGKIMQQYGTKMVFYHSHDEKPNVSYPRLSFGEAFATAVPLKSAGFAVLGSHLFFVGGSVSVSCSSQFQLRPHSEMAKAGKYVCFSTDVLCCEFSVSDLSIRSVHRISGMKYPRMDPLVLVLDNKLYILGGLERPNDEKDEKGVWIEVFNPDSKKWSDISDPPVEDMQGLFCYDGHACVALEHSREILVATDNEICLFSVEKDAWHRIIGHGKEYAAQGLGITIGQTAYWFYAERIRLFAYDVQTGEWMDDCMTAIHPRMRHYGLRMARGSGDSLCLLWTVGSELHCFHFRVSYVQESFPFADVEFCIQGDMPELLSLENCCFVGEESVSTES